MVHQKKCPDCEKRKKVTDEMLKANIGQVLQNKKLYQSELESHPDFFFTFKGTF